VEKSRKGRRYLKKREKIEGNEWAHSWRETTARVRRTGKLVTGPRKSRHKGKPRLEKGGKQQTTRKSVRAGF